MATLVERLKAGTASLCVIGLGYVGLPLAVAFAGKGIPVIGYDVDASRIEAYQRGEDVTDEVGDDALRASGVVFTSDASRLREGIFHIVTVPTPIHPDTTPDMSFVLAATRTIGEQLVPGAYVVYESTVYPGATEQECIPVLEQASGMRCGPDFKVGYSPERINPADRVHRLENIVKVVSGIDEAAAADIDQVYRLIIQAGTRVVSNIRTAEMVKVVENTQRDYNIAFMNEVARIAKRMDVDTHEMLDAMNTKWNALRFEPGLVGGHCIGVDPYYFTYQAERLGYHSQLILESRRINDSMGRYIAETAIRLLMRMELLPQRSRIAILGVTFKENCIDLRNTRVLDLVQRLQEDGVTPMLVDPVANPHEVQRMFGLPLTPMEALRGVDCIIAAVSHDCFRRLPVEDLQAMYSRNHPVLLMDVKAIYPREALLDRGFQLWRL